MDILDLIKSLEKLKENCRDARIMIRTTNGENVFIGENNNEIVIEICSQQGGISNEI